MLKFIPLFLLSASAFASTTTTCTLPEELDGTVEFTMEEWDRNNPNGYLTSKLTVAGKEIPQRGDRCFFKNVPGRTGWLCGHKDGDVIYDVYPGFVNQADYKVSGVQVLRWNADGSIDRFTTPSCE